MKKSEVIRDLAIFLMGRLPEWQKTERLKFADEIINELEIIGIQPPQTILDKLVPCELREVDGQPRNYYACWEPEDKK